MIKIINKHKKYQLYGPDIGQYEMYEDGSYKNCYEMARIGITDDGYELYINSNDHGNIPHFHYRIPNNWEKI